MASTSLYYYGQELAQAIPYDLTLAYSISASRTVSPSPQSHASLITFGALTQAQIDNYLGTTSEFLAAQFDGASMGAESFGVLVNMLGQGKSVHGFESHAALLAGTTVVQSLGSSVTTLTSSAVANQIAVGSSGNIAMKFSITGFDALTTGSLIVRALWFPK